MKIKNELKMIYYDENIANFVMRIGKKMKWLFSTIP